MKVALIDDHPTLRKGLAVLFIDEGWTVVGEAWDMASSKELFYLDWDVAILDVQLQDVEGFEVLRAMREAGVDKPVLVHSMLPDSVVAARVFKEGGNGYINKCSSPDELVAAATKVAKGGRYVSPDFVELVAASLSAGQPTQLHDSLSQRELQVLKCFGRGLSRIQIAEELQCSANTISTYQSRILKKLQIKSTLEIMQYAIKNRLIQL